MKFIPFGRRVAAILAAASALVLAPLSAGAYSSLVVFGDSVSDSGNAAIALLHPDGVPQTVSNNAYVPAAPYFPSGTFSNGAVWATDYAALLGLSAAPSLRGGTNYAFGGARVDDGSLTSLASQVGMFLHDSGGAASPGALYVIAPVGNDARDALGAYTTPAALAAAASAYASGVGRLVEQLRDAGAQDFLVFNTVNLGILPAVTSLGSLASGLATTVSSAFDGALAAQLAGARGVQFFDAYSFLNGVVNDPAAFGFGNATDACGAVGGADCSRYVFWDGLHPTAAMQGLIAETLFAAAVPEPSTYALFALGLVAMALMRRRTART